MTEPKSLEVAPEAEDLDEARTEQPQTIGKQEVSGPPEAVVKEFVRIVLANSREIYLGSSSMDCTALANIAIQLHALIKNEGGTQHLGIG